MHLQGCRPEVGFNVFPVTFLAVSVGKKIGKKCMPTGVPF
jgi:hypothetical protein